MNKKLINVCKNILFGIELETCYNYIGKTSEGNLSYQEKYNKSKIDNKINIFNYFNQKSSKIIIVYS